MCFGGLTRKAEQKIDLLSAIHALLPRKQGIGGQVRDDTKSSVKWRSYEEKSDNDD